MIEKKANLEHSHSLSDESITDILPVSKGGTGSATLTGARSNLGLGSASTKDVTTIVSSGNTNLVTSGAVYSAINNVKINKRTHIVVATYDTKNPLKANADYTCTASNASTIIKTAINAVAQGGKVELLDGTYNLQYDEEPIELTKSITIEGSGYYTTIHQQIDSGAGEAKPIFNITSQNVTIKNMMLCDAEVTSPVSMIIQSAQGAIYDNIFFIFNAYEEGCENSCIEGKENCNFTRIQNCRVYKSFNTDDSIMFNFKSCSSFGGVVGGNISSGYGNISIALKNESHKNNTAFYGYTNIDIKV